MSTIQIRIKEKTKKGIPFNLSLDTDRDLKQFHKLAETSLEFWNSPKDDIYSKFYHNKKLNN